MLTLLLYVLIVGLVAALLFLVASAVFGRGEELGPLPEGTTVTVLPAENIGGSDVRALRFQQVLRGYKAGEVDWALTRLAARIDDLEWQLAQAHAAQDERAEVMVGAVASRAGSAAGSVALGKTTDTPGPRRISSDADGPDGDGVPAGLAESDSLAEPPIRAADAGTPLPEVLPAAPPPAEPDAEPGSDGTPAAR